MRVFGGVEGAPFCDILLFGAVLGEDIGLGVEKRCDSMIAKFVSRKSQYFITNVEKFST